MTTTILDPSGPLAEGAVQLAPAAPALVGGKIGVLDNGKPTACCSRRPPRAWPPGSAANWCA